MSDEANPMDMITDYLTGREIPDTGAEANRQAVERYLVEEKGYAPEEIEVDVPIEIGVSGEAYRSVIDLIVTAEGRRFVGIKCAAASLASWEREIVAACRLLEDPMIPYAMVSDGKTARLIDTATGRLIGEGLAAIPNRTEAAEQLPDLAPTLFPEEKREREGIIFRSYDSMNVNRRV
ncbi:MAG: type I restriction enzyme HsdR N-terminal domain-containing protein [Desulfococcaceae bacterium]